MMPLVDVAYRPDPFEYALVSDATTQCVARISRVYDDAARADDLSGLADQARLRIDWMNGEELRQLHQCGMRNDECGIKQPGPPYSSFVIPSFLVKRLATPACI